MRIPLRSFATLLLALGVATCSDTPIATVKTGASPGRAGFGRINLAPTFSKSAQFVASHAAQFGAVAQFDSVHISIRGFPDTTFIVLDTTIIFTNDSQERSLDLTIPVQADGQRFDAAMAYKLGASINYYGHAPVTSYPPGTTPPPPPKIEIAYAGPGSNATRLAVAPKAVTLVAPLTTTFTATAFDVNGASVTPPPIAWTSSDGNIATVSAVGPTATVSSTGRRGTVTITAQGPNTTTTDNATVSVTLPPAAIALVSGGGQTGKVGTALASAAVVQVSASDGVGVAGVGVLFSAPAGGSVGTASATTDASGRASTTLRLGNATGPQGFGATAGVLAVGIPATATAGDPATIAVVSGSGQSDTVRKAVKNPLVVKVSDAFNNPVPGAVVSWARTGTGALSAASTTTGTDGTTSVGYTLGNVVGPESVSASTVGVTATANFALTAIAASPSNIAAVSGTGQSGTIGTALGAPFVVRVTDDAGNPTAGATVTWSATNGTIAATSVTDATGQASATLTLARIAGPASATASLANGRSVTFTATATPGVPARVVWRVQPTTTTAGVAITPAPQASIVDADNNLVTTSSNAVTLTLAGGPSGAVLSGTLTKNAVAGVATFDDLKVDRGGAGFTLVAGTSGPTTTFASAGFNITAVANPVARTMQLIDGTTLAPIVGSAFVPLTAGVTPVAPPLIKITDAGGLPVANVAVSFSAIGNHSNFTGNVTTNSQGVVAFVGAITVSDTFAVTATSTGLTGSPLTGTVMVFPAAASQLVFTTPPTPPVPANVNAPLTVTITDAFGNRIRLGDKASDAIALAIVSGPSEGSLSGATKTASQGAAVFNALQFSQPGTYVLRATSTPNEFQTAANLTVVVGGAFILTAVAPTTYNVLPFGSASPAPKVHLTQADGTTPVAGRSITWTPSAGGGTVSKGTSGNIGSPSTISFATDANGDAQLSSWVAFGSVGSFPLTATVGGSSIAVTFTMNVGSPAGLQALTPGEFDFTAKNDSGFRSTLRVQLVDATNHPVSTAGVQVTAAIVARLYDGGQSGRRRPGPGPAEPTSEFASMPSLPTVTNATATTDANGIASFTTIRPRGTTQDFAIHFTSGTLTATTIGDFSLIAGTAVKISAPDGSGQFFNFTVTGAATFPSTGLNARLFDVDNNSSSGPTITWSTMAPCQSISVSMTTAAGQAPTINTANAPGSCRVIASAVDASSNPLIGSPVSYYLTLVPASVSVNNWANWHGGVSDDWLEPGNWSTNRAPNDAVIAGANFYIPRATPHSPKLSADFTLDARNLSLESGPSGQADATLNLYGHQLTTNGAVDAGSASSVGGGVSSGTLVLTAAGSFSTYGLAGNLPTTTVGVSSCGGRVFNLTGRTKTGALTIACPLHMSGQTLTTLGDLSTIGNGGALTMQNTADVVNVGDATHRANASFGGFPGAMSAGVLSITGNFAQINNSSTEASNTFAAAGTHKTRFTGNTPSPQTIHFDDPSNSYFNRFEALNTAADVYFTSSAMIKDSLTVGPNATLATGDGAFTLDVYGNVTTRAGSNMDEVEILTLRGGTRFPHFGGSTTPKEIDVYAPLPMDTSATLTGTPGQVSLQVQNHVNIGTFTLHAAGAIIVSTTTGRLSLATGGTIFAGQNLVFQTPTYGTASSFTGGTIEVQGSFSDNGAIPTHFDDPDVIVKLSGTGDDQPVFLSDPVTSAIHNLHITGTHVTFYSDVKVLSLMEMFTDSKVIVSGGEVGRQLTVGESGTLKLHGGTTVTINGSVAVTTCQRHDGVTGHAAPVINGANTGTYGGAAYLQAKCDLHIVSLP